MGFTRRDIILGLIALSLPMATSRKVVAQSEQAQPKQIRIGYQVIPNGELLSKALNLVKKAFPNTEVKYISFDSGRDVNTAFAANGIDFGVIGSVPASVGIAQGLPYEVYFIHDIIGEVEALVVKKDIKTLADLKGKKVATPFGSTAHFSLQSLLKLENISEKELTILDMQPPEIVAAWMRGDIQGAYVWQPNLTKIKNQGGNILVTSADLAKKGVVTADLGVVSKDFIKKYPSAVKTYVGVLDQAIKFYRNNPEEAIKALSGELGITPEETKVAVKELIWLDSTQQKESQYLGTTEKPGEFAKILKKSADFVVAQKTINSAPDLKTFQQNIYTKAL